MKASDAVYRMMKEHGGFFTVTTLLGNKHDFHMSRDDKYIYSDSALPNQKLEFSVFDKVADFIRKSGGTVRKGNGHDSKVGGKHCGQDTLMYFVATEIYGHREGESTFDPIFALAAILDNAGVVVNLRGKIKLKAEYMK